MTLGLDLARCLDPVIFARDCGIEPDKWQSDLLRSSARRALLLCARQSGKSTVTALLALWVAIFEAGLVVIVSPSQRQSAEMLRTIKNFLGRLEGGPWITAESALKLEFGNGARILALPGTEATIRGIAGAAMVIIDEAARIPDELLAAVRPMLATTVGGGRLLALTTPAGKRGFFFESWTGTGDWSRVKVAATDCPRISQAFLDEELRELGAMRFSEEYQLEFRDADEAVFPFAVIAAAFSQDVRPLWQ
jgi:Terminase large subunit, T4likevirus-type, N-terminal